MSRFVVLEGGEGSGKTSVLVYLQQHFPDAVFTREPGGTSYAEEIRALTLSSDYAKKACGVTQLLLMFAARRDHINHLIRPRVQEGRLVITDRFCASSWAYNIRAQEEPGHTELFKLLEKAVLEEMHPDLYIFLDVPVQVGLGRRASASGTATNHFDDRKVDFHTRVRDGYLEYLSNKPHVVIDATQSLQSVQQEALQHIRALV